MTDLWGSPFYFYFMGKFCERPNKIKSFQHANQGIIVFCK